MNMITNHKNVVVNNDFEYCEHLKVGDTAFNTVREGDTLSPTTESYCECEACYNERMAKEDTCRSCGRTVLVGDLREWKWFDFYAPQGDEPLELCKFCWDEPKHQKRIKDNITNMEAEYPDDDWDDWDDE